MKGYEQALQKKLDFNYGYPDGFSTVMRKTDSISKLSPDLKLINLMQSHLWWNVNHKLKEPSNEELNLLANLTVSYGAKGIMYFAYNSEADTFTTADVYSRGIANYNLSPRHTNVYGQDKWEAIKKINALLQKWSSHIVNFNNTGRNTFVYRLSGERNLLLDNSYFNNLKAYPQDPNALSSPLNTSDVPDSTFFLQVAIFNNPEEDNSKYFMLVNRRCSPYFKDSSYIENGGRFIKIKLDTNTNSLPGFKNWKIIDLASDSMIVTFDRGSDVY